MSDQRPGEQLLADAVRVLTEAARRTVAWTDPDGHEHRHRADFAEFVTLAVAGAAANLGSIEQALDGRPGSWEAEHVRQMLQSTVGHDEAYLLEHRTEPLVVTVAVDNLLTDLGIWQLYEQAEDDLEQRENALWAATANGGGQVRSFEDLTAAQEVTLEQLDRLRAQLETQRQRDWRAYGEAFAANVHHAAGRLFPSLAVPVQVDVHLDWLRDEAGAEPPWGPAFQLWEQARETTPLPGCGIALRDYPAGDVAQIERDAGRDPLTRLARAEVTP